MDVIRKERKKGRQNQPNKREGKHLQKTGERKAAFGRKACLRATEKKRHRRGHDLQAVVLAKKGRRGARRTEMTRDYKKSEEWDNRIVEGEKKAEKVRVGNWQQSTKSQEIHEPAEKKEPKNHNVHRTIDHREKRR